ncbi:MAG: amylo-alpha-1,6-glucosidase [bacterium]
MNKLATNGIGGYATNGSESRFDGVFFYENSKLMKVIENISDFIMFKNCNCVLVENDKIVLDIRESYSDPEWGRIYDVYEEDCLIIVDYKYKDGEKVLYNCFVAIKIQGNYDYVKDFFRVDYNYDKRRESGSGFRYVYHLLNMDGKALVSFSFDKNKAKEQIENVKGVENEKNIEGNYNLALNSLNSLVTDMDNVKGIYAGLPWFFQFWARDELISLGGIIKTGNYEFAKDVLFKYLKSIMDNGRIPNRVPNSKLGSADGVGWLFKRVYDFFYLVTNNKEHHKYLDEAELRYIKNKLEESIFSHIDNFSKGSFIKNNDKETWMDTTGGTYDTRGGVRIEIQALMLNMYNLHKNLCKIFKDSSGEKMSSQLESSLKKSIKKEMFDGKVLYDGLGDKAIRPNVFIAHYIYPDMFSKKEWSKIFENSLDKLWLDWGGLSTISKDHELFCDYHTGENNRSYHRGDSWYWVNNMAAISMCRVNKRKFKKYIESIYFASIRDIKEMGYYGYSSEIASASKQEPFGCHAQAWSSAMFIELCHELERFD